MWFLNVPNSDVISASVTSGGHVCRVGDRNWKECVCPSCLLWSCLSLCHPRAELFSFSLFLVLCVGWMGVYLILRWERQRRRWEKELKAPFNGPAAAAAQTYAKKAPRCVIPHQYSCHASQKAGKSHFRKSSQTKTSSQKGTNCLGDMGFDTYNVLCTVSNFQEFDEVRYSTDFNLELG